MPNSNKTRLSHLLFLVLQVVCHLYFVLSLTAEITTFVLTGCCKYSVIVFTTVTQNVLCIGLCERIASELYELHILLSFLTNSIV